MHDKAGYAPSESVPRVGGPSSSDAAPQVAAQAEAAEAETDSGLIAGGRKVVGTDSLGAEDRG